MNAGELEEYLKRLEINRDKDEKNNKRAYVQAREISAWLSLEKHGSEEIAKRAQKIIKFL